MHMQYSASVLEDKRHSITSWLEWMGTKGIDVVGEGFDMLPHAQGFNGGIYIDENASAGVPGLFAAGETAGGPHGADRLGGAAIAATQVFGKIAGASAADYAQKAKTTDADAMFAQECMNKIIATQGGGIADIDAAMEQIKTIMWDCGSIVRSAEQLKKGIEKIKAIEKSFSPMEHFDKGIDIKKVPKLRSFIKISKLLLTLMDYRKESRGPHYRTDFPEVSDKYTGAIATTLKDGQTKLDLIDPSKA